MLSPLVEMQMSFRNKGDERDEEGGGGGGGGAPSNAENAHASSPGGRRGRRGGRRHQRSPFCSALLFPLQSFVPFDKRARR